MTYKQRSSITLMTFRMPLVLSFGAGAAAKEPSPRNNVLSSVLCLRLVSKHVAQILWLALLNVHLSCLSNRERAYSN